MTMSHKILTVTLNPSVDILYCTDTFEIGNVHRVAKVSKTAGGKGLNVSNVADILGLNVTATGFLGGPNGEFIKSILEGSGITRDFVDVPINTRNCINIASGGSHTELLEESDTVPFEYAEVLLRKIEQYDDIDFAVISGSLAAGIPVSIYGDIIRRLNDKKIKVIVDVNADILKEVLKEDIEIFMIKPNREEAAALFRDEPVRPEGAAHLIVSLGKDGLECFNSSGRFKVSIPQVEVKNTVGSGDASVAGFIHGYSAGGLTQALQSMAAAGTANAVQETTGYIDINDYHNLLKKVSVRKV